MDANNLLFYLVFVSALPLTGLSHLRDCFHSRHGGS